jgi:hypothetical protein
MFRCTTSQRRGRSSARGIETDRSRENVVNERTRPGFSTPRHGGGSAETLHPHAGRGGVHLLLHGEHVGEPDPGCRGVASPGTTGNGDSGMGWLIFLFVVVGVGLLVWRRRRRGSGEIGEVGQPNDPRTSPRDKPDLGPRSP